MSFWEIALIAFCTIFVIVVGIFYVKNRKKGKCCHDCPNCKKNCSCSNAKNK